MVEPGDNVVLTNVKDGAPRLSMSFFNTEDHPEQALYAIRREVSGKVTATA